MKALLIHLSDLHFSSGENPILERPEDLVASIKDLKYDLEACCVLVTGDIADTGAEDEYLEASEFFSSFHTALVDHLDLKGSPQWYYVPGNHDCNLRNIGEARRAITKQVLEDPSRGLDKNLQKIALSVQENFRGWSEMFPCGAERSLNSLFESKRLNFNDEVLSVNLINTAWLSPKQETLGDVVIPPDAIAGERPLCDLSITLMHHPFPWFEKKSRREITSRIEQISDLIFTGHEHDPDYFAVERLGYRKSRYFEGSVLQLRQGRSPVGFNVVAVDTSTERLQVFQFRVQRDRVTLDEHVQDQWSPYPMDRVRSSRRFVPSESTMDWLQDPGLNLTHREKESVNLSDFFVYPDLDPIDHGETTKPLVRSDNVLGHVLSQDHVLILGEENTGKTALGRTLYSDFREEGFVSVYIQGGEFSGSSEEDIRVTIKRALEEQYVEPNWDRYTALDRSERAVIVDDFEECQSNWSDVISYLSKFADQLVILANSLKFRASELDRGMTSSGFDASLARYEIPSFGHELRDMLVTRWYSIGDPSSWEDDPKYAQRIVNAKRLVDTVLGENYVPARPDLILTILQSEEAAQPLESHVSTYAAFYEVLITRSLADVSTIPGYDLKRSYLSHIAYWFHKNGTSWIKEADLQDLHRKFCSDRDLDLPFIGLIGELLEHGVLEKEDNRYAFHHDYYYYYFAASFIASTYDTGKLEQEIDELASQLHVKRRANILVFISHLSKDPVILDTVLKHTKDIYGGLDLVSLGSLDVFRDLDEAARDAVRVSYEEGDVEETRREALRARDRARREVHEATDEELERVGEGPDDLDPILELNRALKAVEILGLILKNYPSLLAGRKKEILEECYNLGGRALSSMMNLVADHREEVLQDIVFQLQEEFPKYNRERVIRRAKAAMFGFTHLVTHGIVRRVAQAVGSKSLEITFDKVYERSSVAIEDLYYCSVRLDQWYSFPRELIEKLHDEYSDQLLIHSVLQRLVRDHFNLFPRKVPLRQSVCDMLGIEYREIQRSDPRRELVSREEE